jgi:hypothetical protein
MIGTGEGTQVIGGATIKIKDNVPWAKSDLKIECMWLKLPSKPKGARD